MKRKVRKVSSYKGGRRGRKEQATMSCKHGYIWSAGEEKERFGCLPVPTATSKTSPRHWRTIHQLPNENGNEKDRERGENRSMGVTVLGLLPFVFAFFPFPPFPGRVCRFAPEEVGCRRGFLTGSIPFPSWFLPCESAHRRRRQSGQRSLACARSAWLS